MNHKSTIVFISTLMLMVIYNSLTLTQVDMMINGNLLIDEINNNEQKSPSGDDESNELDIVVNGQLHINEINNYAPIQDSAEDTKNQVEAPSTISTTSTISSAKSKSTIVTGTTLTTMTTTTTALRINFYTLAKFGVLNQKISDWGPKNSNFSSLTECSIVTNIQFGIANFYYYCCDSSTNKMIIFDTNWSYLNSYVNVANGLNSVSRVMNNRLAITSPTSLILTDFSCNQVAIYNKPGANYVSVKFYLGYIYVADSANNVIDVFNTDISSLSFSKSISLGPFYQPKSLHFLDYSYISAFDTNNNTPLLIRFNTQTNYVSAIFNFTSVSCSSNSATVSYDNMGYFALNCATNNRIYVFDAQVTDTLQTLSTDTDTLVSSFVDLHENLVLVTTSAIYIYQIKSS